MLFQPTHIEGAYLIKLEPHSDERGFLARTWCHEDFAKEGITFNPVQSYISHSTQRGTLRGLHYSAEPYGERKLVQCVRGALFEVLVDVRRKSSTFGAWEGHVIAAGDSTLLLIPPYVAHGILTLEDNTAITCLYDQPYRPGVERGVRYDDPAFAIRYPIEVSSVSKKDLSWENFKL